MRLHPASLEFLKVIREQNSREYFASIRPLYEDILFHLQEFIEALSMSFAAIDPDFQAIDTKKCLFRIYRDARRLKPGDPLYKYHRGIVIAPEGTHDRLARPYIKLSPGNSFVGGGIWRNTSSSLYPLRTHLLKHGDLYYKITQEKNFKNYFEKVEGKILKGSPRGFRKDVPYYELIQRQQFLLQHNYSDEEVLSETFFEEVVRNFTLAKPLYDFLNQAFEKY